MIWFSADFHLSHHNILKYCNRPFGSVDEMDDCLFTMLSDTLRKGDTLYYLGDLTFKKPVAEKFFDLCGDRGTAVCFIFGNHDKGITKIVEERAIWCEWKKYVSPNGQGILLDHTCHRVWHKSHFNSWHCYAHSHGGLPPIGKSWDVGIDNNNYNLVSFDQLKVIMNSSPDNFNYLSMEEKE